MTFDRSPAEITPPSGQARRAATERLAQLATPPGALGRLGDIAVWLSSVQDSVPPLPIDDARLVIFSGDHGVSQFGVSAFPAALTGVITRAAVSGQLVTNILARTHGVAVRVLDINVDDDFAELPQDTRNSLQQYKIRRSCGAIHIEDAMTPAETTAALLAGAEVARHEIADGAQLLMSGDLGIGNTTPAAALVAAGLGLPAREVVGRGTGIDDAMLTHKIDVVQQALDRAGTRTDDGVDTLTALGSPDLAAATGFLLTAADLGTPVLLDGLMAVACALTADRIRPGAAAWFAAGHRSTEPAQSMALDKLGLTPVLDLDLRVGEGSGAVAALPLIRSASAVLRDVALLPSLLDE